MSSTPPGPVEPLVRRATRLLVLMTIACIGGPVLIMLVLSGGAAEGWPPDRPIEHIVFWSMVAVVTGLMVISAVMAVGFQRRR